MTATLEPIVSERPVPPPDPDHDITIQQITETHRQWRVAVAQKIALSNALGAQIRCYLGYKSHVPDEEKKSMKDISERVGTLCGHLFDLSKQYVDDHGETITAENVSSLRKDQAAEAWFETKIDKLKTKVSKEAKKPSENVSDEDKKVLKHWWLAALTKWMSAHYIQKVEIDHCERQLLVMTRQLYPHVVKWVQSDRCTGFSLVGLAHIVAETGDLRKYANPGKLWKRCGVAVIGGCAQGFPRGFWKDEEGQKHGTVTAETWTKHGHSGKRHSVVWNVGVSLTRQSPENPPFYKKVYMKRKEYEKAKHPVPVKNEMGFVDYTPKHLDNRARRYALKKFLKDLWNCWCFGEVSQNDYVVTPESVLREKKTA